MSAYTSRREWALELLRRQADEVRTSAQGGRNTALFHACLRMLAYIDEGQVSPAEVEKDLRAAGTSAGLPSREVDSTIRSGLSKEVRTQAWYPAHLAGPVPWVGGSSRTAPLPRRRPAQEVREAQEKVREAQEEVRRAEDALRVGVIRPLAEVVVDYLELASFKVSNGTQTRKAWADLVRQVREPYPPPVAPPPPPTSLGQDMKHRTRLWAPGYWPESSRATDAAKPDEVALLTVDYDAGVSAEDLERWWGAWAYVAHSTPSHLRLKDGAPAVPRWRVLLPLARPVKWDAEWRMLRDWLCDPRAEVGPVDGKDRGWFIAAPTRWNPDDYQVLESAGAGLSLDGTQGRLLDPDACFGELTAWEELDEAERRVEEEAPEIEAEETSDTPTVSESRLGLLLDGALERMQGRADGRERPIPLPWDGLSERLGGGLWPGLHVLVGNTGSGKSQLALQLAVHAAKCKIPTLYLGLELGQLDLVARVIGLHTSRKWSRLYLGTDPAELPSIRDDLDDLRDLPLHLETGDSYAWDYERIRLRAGDMAEAYPTEGGHAPILLVVDYLQLLASPPDRPGEDVRERVGRAAYVLRDVARRFDAAVLVLSSTAREHYRTLDEEKQIERPEQLVGLGKESGELEYSADSLWVLRRLQRTDGESRMQLGVAKVRAGTPGWVHLSFNGGRFRQVETPEAWEAPAPAPGTRKKVSA